MMDPSLQTLVDEWLRLDHDHETREEIFALHKACNTAELHQRLVGRIAFGTAGLRARMEAGFTRMNSLTVIQASQGLADYVIQCDPNARNMGIVVGFDGRHNSLKFAKLSALAFTQRGIKVWLMRRMVHTPLVPFAVVRLGAVAGIMVTASHNPKLDNGYKVHWTNGCQIIPPHDIGIATSIDRNLEPLAWDMSTLSDSHLVASNTLELIEEQYYTAVLREAMSRASETLMLKPLSAFVYTAMHGVGLLPLVNVINRMTDRTFRSCTEYSAIELSKLPFQAVEAQAFPHPDFPTTPKPNPEEHGAMTMAIELAKEHNLSLAIATDPDADRFSAAVKTNSGEFRQLTGDEIGVLLAAHIIECSTKSDAPKAILNTVVSSRMLRKMALANGYHYEETLTGFKWLGNRALSLMAEGYDIPFAYEEAIGYMFAATGVVDKDGVAAAAVFLVAIAAWRGQGFSAWQKLQQLYTQYGYHGNANTYITSSSTGDTDQAFSQMRQLAGHVDVIKQGGTSPDDLASCFLTVAGYKVLFFRDMTCPFQYEQGEIKDNPLMDGSNMITYDLESARFTVRSSGTEPKIKLYIEAWHADSLDKAESMAHELEAFLRQTWLRTAWLKSESSSVRN